MTIEDAIRRAAAYLREARIYSRALRADEIVAVECAERGYFLSMAGPITYPKNAHLREAAAAVPLASAPQEREMKSKM